MIASGVTARRRAGRAARWCSTPQPKAGMTTLTQQDLEARLWGSANALRGPVDPADFKTYVFPMLFWKWISDTWEHEHAEALEVYGDDLNDEVEADYHRFGMPPECLWSQVVTKTALHNPGCSRGLKPPLSSSDLAM